MTKKIHKLSIILVALSLGFTLLIGSYLDSKASALSGGDFQAGRIIDDAIFTNKNSMTVQQIQAFLNSKMPTCWIDHPIYTSPSSGNTYYPPYTCLKDYQENPTAKTNNYGQYNPDGTPASIVGGISAAQIIWDAGQEYNINPQALIVLLQKEQGLVTDDWPILPQYEKATGYACDDSGGIATCSSSFYQQVNDAAWQFRNDMNGITVPGAWGPFGVGLVNIYYSPNAVCATKSVYIENKATAVLYKYTPYTPNDAALANLYGTGDGCSAYGNRNFWRYFNDWFGNTLAFTCSGIDYSIVFDPQYYLDNNPDIEAAFGEDQILAFSHFINYGMSEGRQGNADFNVSSYKNRYYDLRRVYGDNARAYAVHYILYGKSEGRIATGDYLGGTSMYNGVDYSAVYSFDYYEKNNPDIKTAFGLDDTGALSHFINYGMSEGRQGNADFNVSSYKNRYYDLRRVYGDNARAYAVHYILYGKSEGRIATGDYLGGTSMYNGVDYSAVYSFDYYEKNNPDIKTAFGLDDTGALSHFINYGMSEGRQGNADFNVSSYRANYIDLQAAFGQDLWLYYLHYVNYGLAENRIAV